jgi:hypothetical protein
LRNEVYDTLLEEVALSIRGIGVDVVVLEQEARHQRESVGVDVDAQAAIRKDLGRKLIRIPVVVPSPDVDGFLSASTEGVVDGWYDRPVRIVGRRAERYGALVELACTIIIFQAVARETNRS